MALYVTEPFHASTKYRYHHKKFDVQYKLPKKRVSKIRKHGQVMISSKHADQFNVLRFDQQYLLQVVVC